MNDNKSKCTYCGKPLVKWSANAHKDWNNRKIHRSYWKL